MRPLGEHDAHFLLDYPPIRSRPLAQGFCESATGKMQVWIDNPSNLGSSNALAELGHALRKCELSSATIGTERFLLIRTEVKNGDWLKISESAPKEATPLTQCRIPAIISR